MALSRWNHNRGHFFTAQPRWIVLFDQVSAHDMPDLGSKCCIHYLGISDLDQFCKLRISSPVFTTTFQNHGPLVYLVSCIHHLSSTRSILVAMNSSIRMWATSATSATSACFDFFLMGWWWVDGYLTCVAQLLYPIRLPPWMTKALQITPCARVGCGGTGPSPANWDLDRIADVTSWFECHVVDWCWYKNIWHQ